jgi:hypothetical protein
MVLRIPNIDWSGRSILARENANSRLVEQTVSKS